MKKSSKFSLSFHVIFTTNRFRGSTFYDFGHFEGFQESISLSTSTTMIMHLESSLGLKNMLVKSYEFSGQSSTLPKKSREGNFFQKIRRIFKKIYFLCIMKVKSYKNQSESTSRCCKHNFQQMLNPV